MPHETRKENGLKRRRIKKYPEQLSSGYENYKLQNLLEFELYASIQVMINIA